MFHKFILSFYKCCFIVRFALVGRRSNARTYIVENCSSNCKHWVFWNIVWLHFYALRLIVFMPAKISSPCVRKYRLADSLLATATRGMAGKDRQYTFKPAWPQCHHTCFSMPARAIIFFLVISFFPQVGYRVYTRTLAEKSPAPRAAVCLCWCVFYHFIVFFYFIIFMYLFDFYFILFNFILLYFFIICFYGTTFSPLGISHWFRVCFFAPN